MSVLFELVVPADFYREVEVDSVQGHEESKRKRETVIEVGKKAIEGINENAKRLVEKINPVIGVQTKVTAVSYTPTELKDTINENNEVSKALSENQILDEQPIKEFTCMMIHPPEVVEDLLQQKGIHQYYRSKGKLNEFARVQKRQVFEESTDGNGNTIYGKSITEALAEKQNVLASKAREEYEANTEYVMYLFNIDNADVEEMTRLLIANGVGAPGGFGWFNVIPVQTAYTSLPRETQEVEASVRSNNNADGNNSSGSILKKIRQSIKSRLAIESVVQEVKAGAEVTFDYIVFVAAASIIACVGLVTDNTVAIVASMLVSPLMGPILGFTFGFFLRDWNLFSIGLKSELLGLLISFIIGFIGGLISTPIVYSGGGILPTSEMCSRVSISGFVAGFFIAVPSGVGVALSVLGGNMGGLVGVAISASLLPPAVNSGLIIGMGAVLRPLNVTLYYHCEQALVIVSPLPDDFLGHAFSSASWSFGLTLMNIFVIFAASVIMFRVKSVVMIQGKDAEFWTRDLRYARKYNKLVAGEETELPDIDPENGLLGDLFLEPEETVANSDVEKVRKDDAKLQDSAEQREPSLGKQKTVLHQELKRLLDAVKSKKHK